MSKVPAVPSTVRRLGAALLAATLAMITVLTPVSVGAADPISTEVSVATTSTTTTVQITGTGYTDLPNASTGAPAAGVYVALRDPAVATDAAINADNSAAAAFTFVPKATIVGGNFSTTLTVNNADLTPGAKYEVIVWSAHGNITESTKITTIPVTATTVTVASATESGGLVLTVDGIGYINPPKASTGAPSAGVYVALRDPATTALADLQAESPAFIFVPKATILSGTWTGSLTAAAADLDPDANYEIVVWSAHGEATPATVITTIPVELTDAQREAMFPGWTPPTDTTVPPSTTPPTTAPGTTAPATTAPATTTRPTTTTRPVTTTKPSSQAGSTDLRCVYEPVAGTAGTPSLSWGVKGSFVSYVEGIAKGRITIAGGVVRNGNTFVWPTGTGSLDSSNRGTWTFPGSVNFWGHDGVMNTTLANIRVQVNSSTSGALIADVTSEDAHGGNVGGANMTIADLTFSQVSPSGANATATLTAAGATALNSVYDAGEALDPLSVTTSGGTDATMVEKCYDAQGNLVSSSVVSGPAGRGGLPATGSRSAQLATFGLALLAAGSAATVIAARRRRAAGALAP